MCAFVYIFLILMCYFFKEIKKNCREEKSKPPPPQISNGTSLNELYFTRDLDTTII